MFSFSRGFSWIRSCFLSSNRDLENKKIFWKIRRSGNACLRVLEYLLNYSRLSTIYYCYFFRFFFFFSSNTNKCTMMFFQLKGFLAEGCLCSQFSTSIVCQWNESNWLVFPFSGLVHWLKSRYESSRWGNYVGKLPTITCEGSVKI